MTIHEEKARDLFLQGYNCAQAVFAAFCDMTHIPQEQAFKLSSSFGGGIGRLREVCGAVSGMLAVAGLLYGYADPEDNKAKMDHYALVQHLAGKFREQAGSIVCREILKNPPSDPKPTPRTEEFYKQRPCVRLVILAAQILDAYIAEHPVA